uniref:Uncharacterized protein n=1 Tax=Oryzias melastigma TaxID=30732 RepID=A0A3B3BTQ8_ORYME
MRLINPREQKRLNMELQRSEGIIQLWLNSLLHFVLPDLIMMDQCVGKISLVGLLLFSLGACYPSRKSGSGQTGLGFDGSYTSRFGSGRGSNTVLFNEQDAGLGQVVTNAMTFKPERPFPRFAWTSEQVPLGMVEQRPLYPSSHVVYTSSGYQRARDFRSDAKYTQDTFDHIPLPSSEGEKGPTGSKGQKAY